MPVRASCALVHAGPPRHPRSVAVVRTSKRGLFHFRLLTFAFCLLPCLSSLQAQGPARSVHVIAGKARLVSGEQIPVSAIARDQNGAARPGDSFTWRSTNANMLAVDSGGRVTAGRQLGIADIVATTAGISGSIRFQVLPQRIDVYPPQAEVQVGGRLQFSAMARDLNGEALPNINFAWQVTGANGGGTQAAAVAANGVVTARASGIITVRAIINYTGYVGEYLPAFLGFARLEIKPKNDFRLTRLLSSGEVRHSFGLRPANARGIVANDNGQVALVGLLDGLATALLLYDNGRYDLLAAGGAQGPLASTILTDFSQPALNNRGQVLSVAAVQGLGSALLLASREGPTWLAVQGEPAGGVEALTGFQVAPRSLNDNGDVVFFSNFRLPGTGQNRNGLFRIPAGGQPQRVVTLGDALPGMPNPTGTDPNWALDRDGVVYFTVFSGANRGIYRQERFLPPSRIAGTGDALGGSTIRAIGAVSVSAAGEVAFFYTLNDNTNGLARISGGQTQNIRVNSYGGGGALWIHGTSGVLFWADTGRGWGFHRWNGAEITPVMLNGRLAANNEPLRQVYSGCMNAKGEVFAAIGTAETDWLVVRGGSPGSVLFGLGARVDVTSNIQLISGSLLRGYGSGAPYLLLGTPLSIFQFDGRGLVPRVVVGDTIPGGYLRNVNRRFETYSGDLYFDAAGFSMKRLTPDRLEDVVIGNFRDDSANVGRGLYLFVNSRGDILWDAGTDQNHSRLYLTENGQHRSIATNAGRVGAPPQIGRWQTPGPAGGIVTGWGVTALNDAGRVMAALATRDGPVGNGLYLWANGRWQTTITFPPLPAYATLGGREITGFGNLQAVNDRFYALFNLRQGGNFLAEYRDGEWVKLIGGPNDGAPNGATMNNVNTYDVNRRGEILMIANPAVILRRPDGELRMVHSLADPTESGDFLRNFQDVELREDGRIYFTGLDYNDRTLLYVAEPLRTTLPSRSRQPGR